MGIFILSAVPAFAGDKAEGGGNAAPKPAAQKAPEPPPRARKKFAFDRSIFIREMTAEERKDLRKVDAAFNKVVRAESSQAENAAAAQTKYDGYVEIFGRVVARLEAAGRDVEPFRKQLKSLEEGKEVFLERASKVAANEIIGMKKKPVKKAAAKPAQKKEDDRPGEFGE